MVVIIVSEFSIIITGQINNFNLPKNQPLLPLFHAIEERRDKDKNFTAGEISIKIIREIKLELMKTIQIILLVLKYVTMVLDLMKIILNHFCNQILLIKLKQVAKVLADFHG